MKFTEYKELFQCPICGSRMRIAQEKRLICKKKSHCFDIAKQGYVNFIPSKGGVYEDELFIHRRSIFQAGFYQPVAACIEGLIRAFADEEAPVILDAGCGEGYYSKAVFQDLPCVKLAFDISKGAVKLAAKGGGDAAWLVADLKRIPIKSDCVDVVLDVLTPADYAEFHRVLKKEGIIIKVVPSSGYLIELRRLARGQLRNKEYDNSETLDYFKQRTDFLKQEQLSYTLPVSHEQAVSFAKMTPMMMGVDIGSLPLEEITAMTIALDIFVGRKPKKAK